MIRDKMFLWVILAFVAFVAVGLMTSCEDEEDLPESGTLSGTITFTGSWPDTGDVFISLQNDWPPISAPYALEVILEGDVSGSEYVLNFEGVAFGTYGALSVSWENPIDANPATNQHILGAYGATIQAYFMDADSLVVSVDNAELAGLDFEADLSLATGQ